MNSRPLTKDESSILQKLTDAGFSTALLFLTHTGLYKSILDATHPVRKFLKDSNIHDFEQQQQGRAAKRILNITLHDVEKAVTLRCSVYRPSTKSGDPRIWPYKLPNYSAANDVVALFSFRKHLHIANLTRLGSTSSPLDGHRSINLIIEKQKRIFDKPSQELFFRLKSIAETGPIPAIGTGSTSIGRSIEHALGIQMNSSREPDYNGIELKSKRSRSSTRDTLFAKTPKWKMSNFKNAREMLNAFGYLRENNVKKLYCSVKSTSANPQGLVLDIDYEKGLLKELYEIGSQRSDVCLWELETLHNRLTTKHNETFWIEANQVKIGTKVGFQLIQAVHTRQPSTAQFDRLLATGEISIDHLLKLEKGKFGDKGHLFKIKASARQELFLGQDRIYDFT